MNTVKEWWNVLTGPGWVRRILIPLIVIGVAATVATAVTGRMASFLCGIIMGVMIGHLIMEAIDATATVLLPPDEDDGDTVQVFMTEDPEG
jgi:outer membrane lipoprotein SlyB